MSAGAATMTYTSWMAKTIEILLFWRPEIPKSGTIMLRVW